MGIGRYFRQFLALFIVVSGVVLTTVIIKRHSGANSVTSPLSNASQGADLSLRQIHLSESEAGNRKWELFAGTAAYDKGEELTRLEHVRFILQTTQADAPLIVTADHGFYWNVKKNIRLSGNVKAGDGKGFRFTADDLDFQENKQLMTTSGVVSVTNGLLCVKGVGMELKTGAMQVKIMGQVEAVVGTESH